MAKNFHAKNVHLNNDRIWKNDRTPKEGAKLLPKFFVGTYSLHLLCMLEPPGSFYRLLVQLQEQGRIIRLQGKMLGKSRNASYFPWLRPQGLFPYDYSWKYVPCSGIRRVLIRRRLKKLNRSLCGATWSDRYPASIMLTGISQMWSNNSTRPLVPILSKMLWTSASSALTRENKGFSFGASAWSG